MEDPEKIIKCKVCKSGVLNKEGSKEQFERVKKGIKSLFPSESEERLDEFTKNYIGYGPNYMFICVNCGFMKKIIPDGRDRE